MSEIILLSGSPSECSKSDKVLNYLGSLLEKEHFSVKHISVKDVPPEVLILGKYDSPVIEIISNQIEGALGVIVGSPVYKAAYSGALKTLLDILPQDVLNNTPVLPLMTGGSPSHLLALEYSLKPLLATLKGQSLKGVYILDSQIDKYQENPFIDEEILQRTKKQLHYFIDILNKRRVAETLSS